MRVRLIPTGRCELLGLASCFERIFPEHVFETVAARVEPDGTRIPYDSFTSGRLRAGLVPDNLLQLVKRLASEVYPGRDGQAADLAVVLEDLELENADQAELVVDTVRAAVRQHVQDLTRRATATTARRVEEALRERASFHLAVPMIEAWFFADPSVLPLAGVKVDRLPPRLRECVDPELFETDDAEFSAEDGSAWVALEGQRTRRRASDRPPWILPLRPELAGYRRERHPKAYLSWLCRDPQEKRWSTYRESQGGAKALGALDWPRVVGNPTHCMFARALLGDLSEVLGRPAAELPSGQEHHLVARATAPQARVLRNV